MFCYHCGSEEETKKFVIANRNYGSIFDGDYIEFYLCEHCLEEMEEFDLWINETPTVDSNGVETYKYEEKLYDFVYSLQLVKYPILKKFLAESYLLKETFCRYIKNINKGVYTEEQFARRQFRLLYLGDLEDIFFNEIYNLKGIEGVLEFSYHGIRLKKPSRDVYLYELTLMLIDIKNEYKGEW